MKLRQTHPIKVAAAKADISRATGYRIAPNLLIGGMIGR
jgi:hypothetical protein